MDTLGIIASGIDAALDTPLGTIVDIASLAKDTKGSVKGVPLVSNPYFIDNAIDGDTEYTRKYVMKRKGKKLGGSVVSFAGGLASSATQVNVGGIARHGAASGNTIAHLQAFHQMSKKFKQSDWLRKHCDVLITAKMAKLGVRGSNLAANCIPNAIASAVVGGATSVGGWVAEHQVGKMTGGIDLSDRGSFTETKMRAAVAVQLHWRAYQEQKLAAVFGGTGPASMMIEELMTRRAHRFLGGGYDWKRLVKEPTGWIAIHDKLNLI